MKRHERIVNAIGDGLAWAIIGVFRLFDWIRRRP